MKRKLSFTVAVWWIILCAIAGFFLIAATNKRSRLSETENRMLAAFPEVSAQTLASGEFMSGFEDFLSDAFFARDGVVQLTDGLLDRFNALSDDEKLVYQARDMEKRMASEGINPAEAADGDAEAQAEDVELFPGEEPAPDAEGEAAPEAAASEAEAAPAPAAAVAALPAGEPMADDAADGDVPAEGGDGLGEADDAEEGGELDAAPGKVPLTEYSSYMWLERTDGRLEKIYTFRNKDIATFADTLRHIRDYLPDDGLVLYTQVPLASIGNRWAHAPRTIVGWGSSCELVLEKCLEGEDHIMIFNCMEIMAPYMAAGAKLFYETDHHWTAEGAYLVAAEMFRRQGLPVIPYDEYSYKSNRGRELKGHTDTFNLLYPLLPGHSYIVSNVDRYAEIPLMNYKSHTYLGFMNNTRFPWRQITTGANTGRKALVICDSFGNAFTPYLLPYYDEVHMVDPRSEYHGKADAGASIGKLMRYHGIDDVYVILSTANGLRKDNSLIHLRRYLDHR